MDDVSGLDKVFVVVGVEGGPDGVVLDDDAVSEAGEFVAGVDDSSAAGGVYGFADGGGDVDAFVVA